MYIILNGGVQYYTIREFIVVPVDNIPVDKKIECHVVILIYVMSMRSPHTLYTGIITFLILHYYGSLIYVIKTINKSTCKYGYYHTYLIRVKF